MKKTFAFLFFVLASIVLGAFIAYLCEGGPSFISWLAWGKSLGINDISVDLYVISLSFSLNVSFTVSQLITIPAGLIVYAKTCKGL
ncbi:MAG: DUF4321 domain-containing protein [Ruminococcus sp.]|nr:DUF4321 domain-containing protein [Ruminococcus sp.]